MSMRMSKRRAAPAWKARRASSWRPRWRRPSSMISETRAAGSAGDDVAHLAVGMIAGRVDERGGEFDFERFGALDEIDDGRRCARAMPLRSSAAACSSSARVWIRYWLGSAYFTSVGAVRTSRVSRLAASAAKSGSAASFSTNAAAARAFTFQAGPVAASRSFAPRSRTSAMGCESRRETCVSSVRAFTIWPSEVLVASGSR